MQKNEVRSYQEPPDTVNKRLQIKELQKVHREWDGPLGATLTRDGSVIYCASLIDLLGFQ